MTVANMILTQNFLYRIDGIGFFLLSLVFAGLLSFFAWKCKAAWFILASFILFTAFAALCIAGFLYASIVPVTLPVTFGFIGAIITGSLLRYMYEEKQKLHFQFQAEAEKKLNIELKTLDELKNKLIHTITHELKNPLMVITAPLKLLAEHYNTYDKREVIEKIEQAEHGAKRLTILVEELLFAVTLKSHKETLCAEEVNICRFIEKTVKTFMYEAERRGITLYISPDPIKINLFMDQVKMHKVISNLLSNALTYTKKGGKSDVEVSRPLLFDKHSYPWESGRSKPEQVVIIRIKDTGIGMEKEELDHIFDLFYQVKDEQKPTFAGTGIRLSIVKEYTSLHHGTIRVESTHGKGSVFEIILPKGKAHLKEDELLKTGKAVFAFQTPETEAGNISPFKEKQSDRVKNGKILVVDDDDDIRQLICHILSENYTVHDARTGKEGYEKAKQLCPDLILCDILMPEMDGLQFLTELKKDPLLKEIPFILVTAKAQPEPAGNTPPVDDYLVKPCDPAQLLKRVENIITLKKQEKIIRTYEKTHIHPIKADTQTIPEENRFSR